MVEAIDQSITLNRWWRPWSPFFMFGWKTAVWIIELIKTLAIFYTLYVVFRTLRGVPLLMVFFYFAAAPLQSDQQLFVDYLNIVTQCTQDLWNQIFLPLMNDAVLCVRPLCCVYNYVVNLLRYNVRLFVDYFRGLVVENMPELLENVFGIPANETQAIMDYLDISLPPDFPCNATGGGTEAYVQCVLDELEQGQPDPSQVLDCVGFRNYRRTMENFYGVPYNVLLHAYDRDGRLTTDGVMDSYLDENPEFKGEGTGDLINAVDDNEWGSYRGQGIRGSHTYKRDAEHPREIHLRAIRQRLEYSMAVKMSYGEHAIQGRNISSFFPGFHPGTGEYETAVLEVMCTYFYDYFEVIWEIFVGIFFIVYDIAWDLIEYIITKGISDITQFFIFLADYVVDNLLDIPCINFTTPEVFAVSLVNCPCELFTDQLGFTYYPAVANDSDSYLAALFSCVGFDCAVDGSGTATLERFYSNCIADSLLSLVCGNDGDCPGGFTCEGQIFVTGVSFSPPDSLTVDKLGFCIPSSKRSVMLKVYEEKIKLESQFGATSYGSKDNSSVEYWKHLQDNVGRIYRNDKNPPITLADIIQREWNETMSSESYEWLRKHSPNKKRWQELRYNNNKKVFEDNIYFSKSRKDLNTFATAATLSEKFTTKAFTSYVELIGKKIFDDLDRKAAQFGAPYYSVDWNNYDFNGNLISVGGVPVEQHSRLKRDQTTYENPPDDYYKISPSEGVDGLSYTLDQLDTGLSDNGGVSTGMTRAQVMIRALSDVAVDNWNMIKAITWDPLEYSFHTPTPNDMENMFKRMGTEDKWGKAVYHMAEAAKEHRETRKNNDTDYSGFAQFSVSTELLVTRYVCPSKLGIKSELLSQKSPLHAAAVKRILPTLTEGKPLETLMEQIDSENSTIWDMRRFVMAGRRKQHEEMVNDTYRWAVKQRMKMRRSDADISNDFIRISPLETSYYNLGGKPPVMQRALTTRLPVIDVIFQIVLPILKNPKVLATGVAPFLTSRYGMVVTYNVLRALAKPLEHMYSKGLVNTLGNPTELQKFAEDFGMAILNNMIFLIEEGIRLMLCNWWAIVLNFISGIVGVFISYIPYLGMVLYFFLGFLNSIGSGISLMFSYCPPKPVLDNYMPVDLPWNYLFNLLDCNPETACKYSSDCISNAPCRCERTAQYESFFWEFDGDRDNEPCEDGSGMATGYCLCWPNLPCDFAFPEMNINKDFNGNCKEDFGYVTKVSTWQRPGFFTWIRKITIDWYIWSQFATRAFSQGRSRYLGDTMTYLLMTVSLGISAFILKNKQFIVILLIWLGIAFVWDLWSDILKHHVVPKLKDTSDYVLLGPISKFVLSWIRFPNHSNSMILGDRRDGEGICFLFNTPTASMWIGGSISVAAIIYALWITAIFVAMAQYIAYVIMIIPTAMIFGSQSGNGEDADLDAIEDQVNEELNLELLESGGGLPPESGNIASAPIQKSYWSTKDNKTYYINPEDGPTIYYVSHSKNE